MKNIAEMLSTTDKTTQQEAIRLLTAMDGEEAVAILFQTLITSAPEIKLSILEILENYDDEFVTNTFIQIIEAKPSTIDDMEFKWHVVDTLKHIRDDKTVPYLINALIQNYGVLEFQSSDLREVIGDALKMFPSPSLEYNIINLLEAEKFHPTDTTETHIRQLLIGVLGHINSKSAFEYLITHLLKINQNIFGQPP